MKIGVCRGLDDFEGMKAAAGIVDYWETGFGALSDYTDSKFEECKAALKALAIPCIASNGFIPGRLKIVGENVDYPALCDYLDRGFERAKSLGVKKVVFGSGAARNCPDDFSPEKAEEQLVYFLSEYAAVRAEKSGCIIVMEPLRFAESNMIHTVSDGVNIALKSQRSNVFGLADLYHVYGNGDSISGIAEFKGKVCHAHIAEPERRRYPSCADSDVTKSMYRDFLSVLKEVGCDTCSVEARTDDFAADIKAAVALLKEISV